MQRKLEFALAAVTVAALTGVGAFIIDDDSGDFAQALALSANENPEDAESDSYRPITQDFLNELLERSGKQVAFKTAFEAGDELTEISFTRADGVGANVGEGRRFSRLPRADLKAVGEWAMHLPKREGGPNATSCIACHNSPGPNGAGDVAVNAVVDPTHSGDPSKFLERNTLPLMALGVPQRLAEEMTMELAEQRTRILRRACNEGQAEGKLSAKGVEFGALRVVRNVTTPCKLVVDWSQLEGVDKDLVIKPFGWKGNQATIRAFTRNAAHNELGLQSVELVGDSDGDHDGVSNELTVGDLTALTIYMAALERPVTQIELADLGLHDLSTSERQSINNGQKVFGTAGCATCHVPKMSLKDTQFSEPSATPGHYDIRFPNGKRPSEFNLLEASAIRFDLAADQPNNRIEKDGAEVLLGALARNETGGADAFWYSDFKRHDMGPELADPTDLEKIGAQMWLTRSLAGVGSTGPWLHDGRATTLDEAIRAHGGDGDAARQAYLKLASSERNDLIRFLENLVIYKQEEDDE